MKVIFLQELDNLIAHKYHKWSHILFWDEYMLTDAGRCLFSVLLTLFD